MSGEWRLSSGRSRGPGRIWTVGREEAGSVTIAYNATDGDVDTPYRIVREGPGWRVTSVADEAEAADLRDLGVFDCEDRAMAHFVSWYSAGER